MTLANKIFLSSTVALFVVTLFALGMFSTNQAHATAGFLPATVATSSNPAMTANIAQVLIATSTCSARIISTASTSLMLTFRDGDTPTGLFGVYQAASTTVVYDGGQYGCGQISGMATQSGRVTVIDSR